MAERYTAIKADLHLPPHRLGRRAVALKAAEEFWRLDPSLRLREYSSQTSGPSPSSDDDPLITEPDPLDLDDVGGGNGGETVVGDYDNDGSDPNPLVAQRGIIVRTNFSNDASWSSFLNSVLTSEREGMRELVMESRTQQHQTSSTSASAEDEEGSSEDEDEDEDDQGDDIDVDEERATYSSSAFVIIDPSSSPSPPLIVALTPLLHNAFNLTLLRLFADIDIVPCLPVPPGQQRKKQNYYPRASSSRLIDSHGFHEIYNGRLIWVYDTKSNSDGCARLISGRPTSYGTATGDSWRARAPFIWELHVNISAKTMQVDFGGEDRYDSAERMRNFDTVDVYSL